MSLTLHEEPELAHAIWTLTRAAHDERLGSLNKLLVDARILPFTPVAARSQRATKAPDTAAVTQKQCLREHEQKCEEDTKR